MHIDGALTFTFSLINEVLEESLKNNTEITLSEQIAKLCQNSIFISSIGVEIKVETCFLILSILSHLIKKRPEIM